MITDVEGTHYCDPPPERIGAAEWHTLFKEIPEKFIDHYRYYRQYGRTDWNTYLFPPSSFIIYGSRYLRKLTFDNSLASLRLWGFMLNESERLFRGRQVGMKIIANMGDLGAIPPLVYSFGNTVPFYPDCYWWTPFLNESRVLFDEAEHQGIGSDCCFVRAALGAFSKLAYFPKPALCIGATGASCDDMAAVMQHVSRLGNRFYWFEIPHRKQRYPWFIAEQFEQTESHGIEYQACIKDIILAEYRQLVPELEKITNTSYCENSLRNSIKKINTLRKLIGDIKDLTFTAEAAPLPALEIMNIEFSSLSAYSDLDEAIDIMRHIKATVQDRIEQNIGISDPDALRIFWVTPPADPLLMNYMENLGGRLVGTEFIINQALHPLKVADDPLESLSDGLLNASLMGTSAVRAQEIIRSARKYRAEGVIISNIFASSHCASETNIIKKLIRKELNIPILTFDVVEPGKQKMQSQILNRMSAFMELLREKRNKIYA